MRAVEQWVLNEKELPADWSEVQVSFTPEGSVADAAAVLGPLQPGRVGNELRLHIERAEGGIERARNIFRALDRRRIWGTLSLVGVISDVVPVRRSSGSPSSGRAHSRSSGTRRSQRSRRTGATSSASWSSTRATTCPGLRCSAHLSTRRACRARSRSASAHPASRATASRRRWRGAASSAWTPRG